MPARRYAHSQYVQCGWNKSHRYHLFRGKLWATDDCQKVFQRIDYMAKHRTKQYSNKVRTLGCSVSA
ncbi:YagK/YfjJ domain-containing protein [Hafnia paralvei]|uniref:YagK/YfjJ domain-containing protein n=1 Tax=Hafnia paralvei TaxID=546367 RepID=UPI00352AFC25